MDIRDKRMALTVKEVEARDGVLVLMKKHKKRHYAADGIEVEVITEKEKVKVKVADEDADDE